MQIVTLGLKIPDNKIWPNQQLLLIRLIQLAVIDHTPSSAIPAIVQELATLVDRLIVVQAVIYGDFICPGPNGQSMNSCSE